jgi:hypothetical protein
LTVITSLVLIFFFLPYTLLLLLGHKLHHLSRRKVFHWLNRLKPLLDSYHAPYNITTRYWTGFLLVVRCALYIVFSFNSLEGKHKSVFAITASFTAVGFLAGFLNRGRVYKMLAVNILEAVAYFNLVTLSAVTANFAHDTHVRVVVYLLIGIELVIAIGVIVHQFFVQCGARLKLQTVISIVTANQCWSCEKE